MTFLTGLLPATRTKRWLYWTLWITGSKLKRQKECQEVKHILLFPLDARLKVTAEFTRCTVPWDKRKSSARILVNNNPITSTPRYTIMVLCWCLYTQDAASNSDQISHSNAQCDIYIVIYRDSSIFIINLKHVELLNIEDVIWDYTIEKCEHLHLSQQKILFSFPAEGQRSDDQL